MKSKEMLSGILLGLLTGYALALVINGFLWVLFGFLHLTESEKSVVFFIVTLLLLIIGGILGFQAMKKKHRIVEWLRPVKRKAVLSVVLSLLIMLLLFLLTYSGEGYNALYTFFILIVMVLIFYPFSALVFSLKRRDWLMMLLLILLNPLFVLFGVMMGSGLIPSLPTCGVEIASIEPGYPAEAAGLQAGLVISEIDGIEITNQDDFIKSIRGKEEVTIIASGTSYVTKLQDGKLGVHISLRPCNE